MPPGEAMKAVAAWVAQHPGCSKAEAKRGAFCSYASVERAIDAGPIRAETIGSRRRYRLYPPPSGGER